MIEPFAQASSPGGQEKVLMRTRQTKPMKIEMLLLPDSTRAEAAKIAEREGISLTDFVMLAVAEKVTRFEIFQPCVNRPYRS
jgi:hypothetical protein